MKTYHYILAFVLSALFSAGCDPVADTEHKTPDIGSDEVIAFTSLSTKSGGETIDEYGNPYSVRNIREVPDTVGAFIKKDAALILKNDMYFKTKYLSDNYLSVNAQKKPVIDYRPNSTPVGEEEQLYWYKTENPLAYWDKGSAVYEIYAYAPYSETGAGSEYYSNITEGGEVTFEIDKKLGIPADFIYAQGTALTKTGHADNLNMTYKHKLSKLVFQLKNESKNAVVCYGVKYKVEYPVATFNLLTDQWTFGTTSETVDVERTSQYEIFTDQTVALPDLTTLLFPTHATNINGTPPGGVVVNFQVCLNNKWYDLGNILNEDLQLQYTEGKLIELTFNCNLKYGETDGDGVIWNIFAATFDSFEYGGVINGELK